MKQVAITTVTLLLLPVLMAAQDNNPAYRGQGYFVFGAGASTDVYATPTIVQVAGGGEVFAYKGFGVGAEASYAHWGSSPCCQAWIASGDMSYHLGRNPRAGKTDPFVVLGISGFFPTSTGRGSPAGNFGGGVNLWLVKHAALRLEARDYVQQYLSGRGSHYISFRIGMSFR